VLRPLCGSKILVVSIFTTFILIRRLDTQHQSRCRATSLSEPSRRWPRRASKTALCPAGLDSEPTTPSATTPREGTGERLASTSKQFASRTSLSHMGLLSKTVHYNNGLGFSAMMDENLCGNY
ncbi:hypothetical protein E4U13_006075, partial [Claviceps humidiphila]